MKRLFIILLEIGIILVAIFSVVWGVYAYMGICSSPYCVLVATGIISRVQNISVWLPNGSESGCGYTRGLIEVDYDKNISKLEISQQVQSLSPELKVNIIQTYDFSKLQYARIKVPEGEEKKWVDTFKTQDHVNDARLNVYCLPPLPSGPTQ